MGVLRIAAIAQVLDDEGPGAGNGEQRLTRPLVNNVRWAHYERRVRPVPGMHVDRAQRHEGLACTAFSHNARSATGDQILRQPGDRQGLCRQGRTQKGLQTCCRFIFGGLERRVGFHDARPQFRSHRTQIVEVGFHESVS